MALTAGGIYEVRSTASDNNGGGFNPAGSGVDYSQQNSAQYALTGVTSSGAGNVILTASAASDMVGNYAQVISGTNFTTGFFEITSVSVGVSITVTTNNAGTAITTGAGASGVVNIGGSVATIAKPNTTAGITVYVKATATYAITASIALSVSGSAGNPISYVGYTTTRGDNGQVTVQRSSGNLTLMSITGTFNRILNFVCDGNSAGTQTSFGINGTRAYLKHCSAVNFTSNGFQMTASGSSACILEDCVAAGGSNAATAAFNVATLSNQRMYYCVAYVNGCPGFRVASTTAGVVLCHGCISANNVNSADGFITNNVGGFSMTNCVSYGNAGAGLLMDSATTATAGETTNVYNCVFVNNTGVGMSSNSTNYAASGVAQLALRNNFFFGNSSPRNNVPVGSGDVTLTGDPFTNGAGMDFSLNNTAGAGAAVRAAGFPGTLLVGGTGYSDGGALQHQDSGGGGISAYRISISEPLVITNL